MSDAESEQRKIQRQIDAMTPEERERYYGPKLTDEQISNNRAAISGDMEDDYDDD